MLASRAALFSSFARTPTWRPSTRPSHPKAAMKSSLRLPEKSRPLTEQLPWCTGLCNLPTSHTAYGCLVLN